ncbi:MAG: hypothetical protein KZQ78_12920, partial [Candidatus Thiodiazotropha sp. (ex Ustalcina ferruginea)]|nr:hypothetical protein [Candidatus Thiodiazotropha sp. (ex Ustalcina ferruginea)]
SGAITGCRRSSRFRGLGSPEIHHEIKDSLAIRGKRLPTPDKEQKPRLQFGQDPAKQRYNQPMI